MSDVHIFNQPAFSCTLPVRWGDMDAYGHVNNAMYFRYFEEARVRMMETLAGKTILEADTGPVIVTAGCNFLRPVHYPNNVRIDCHLAEPGRSSFMVYYRLFTEDEPEQPACIGEGKVVWINRTQGKSTALPDFIRQAIGGHLGQD